MRSWTGHVAVPCVRTVTPGCSPVGAGRPLLLVYGERVRANLPHTLSQCSLGACPCCQAVRSRAARLRAGRVVCLCSVRLDRAHFARQRRRHRGGAPARALCWRCTCFRFARLRFPCSRCVHLLCVPLLCVPALSAFVRCAVCLCSARLHRAVLVDVDDTTPLVDRGAQFHRIALACPHAACYCTCLSCRNVVCLSNVLLYLLVFAHFLIPFKGLIPS